MSNLKKIIYTVSSVFGLILFFVSLLPVFSGVIHLGVIIPASIGMLISLYSLLSLKYPLENIPWKHERSLEYEEKLENARSDALKENSKLRRSIILGVKKDALENYDKEPSNYVPGMIMGRERRVVIDTIFMLMTALFLVVCVAVMSLISVGYDEFDGKMEDKVIVVLGAKIKKDGKPTYTLEKRLDAALELLNKDESIKCIVTGGRGNDEPISEATAMKKYLVGKGIDENRIFEEGKSKNTKENILNSASIIERNNIGKNMIIVTDKFHQYRANRYAREIGFKSQGYGIKMRNDLRFSYWMREVFAVSIEILKGSK